MRRPAGELNEIVSEVIWLRLGRAMIDCIDHVARILRAGNETGVFEVEDPDFTANMLWTQMLGAMHLARIRVGMKRTEDGLPELFRVEAEQVVRPASKARWLRSGRVDERRPRRRSTRSSAERPPTSSRVATHLRRS